MNPRLSRELGSRHRAAIGITEETDAVAVVVSEETGKISIVVDGRMTRGLSSDILADRLRRLLGLVETEEPDEKILDAVDTVTDMPRPEGIGK
jgi:diadenylate cyclase